MEENLDKEVSDEEIEHINKAFKELLLLYKDEQKDLKELHDGLLDWEKCDDVSCEECKGEMFERCITGMRNAIAALCSSNSFILEQLSIAMTGINNLKNGSVESSEISERKEDEYTQRLYQ